MDQSDIITVGIPVLAAIISVYAAVSAQRQADSAVKQADSAKVQADAAKTQATLAEAQLEELQKKIGMVADPEKMFEVLPVWYVERMGTDDWGFGLLLESSDILAISRIKAVSTDGQWMEVTLLKPGEGPKDIGGVPVMYAPTDRLHASVRISSVQAAFELWTS